jgi:N-acetylglutamate synthase-like GNAT family acetyltransferase
MVIQPAERSDLPAIRRLLENQHLLLDGIDDHVSTMVVAKRGDDVVGAAAVEVYPDGALLRSVVVEPDARGQGLGHRLSDAAIKIAKDRGTQTVFLLTTTAATFFPKLGFEAIARDHVPASVLASIEFRSECCASAVVMRKWLE